MNRQALLAAAAVTALAIAAPSLARAADDANSLALAVQKAQKARDDAWGALQAGSGTGAQYDKANSDLQTAISKYNAYVKEPPPASASGGANPYGCWKPVTAIKKMAATNPDLVCFVAGAFGIPFRAQLSGKKDVFGGLSGDVFAGFNISWGNTASVTLLAYAGYLPTFNTANGSNTGGTGGALDFGAGISTPVWDISTNQKVNLGVVIGTDVTSSNKYSYNGKPYLALLLGSNF